MRERAWKETGSDGEREGNLEGDRERRGEREGGVAVGKEGDRGSASSALEGEGKPRLTGEPRRIDQPACSCQRQLIWHHTQFSPHTEQRWTIAEPKAQPGQPWAAGGTGL